MLYVAALAAPFTINTMPDQTLEAFADHGRVGGLMPAGIDTRALAARLQREGADAFVTSWKDLLARIGSRHEQLSRAG